MGITVRPVRALVSGLDARFGSVPKGLGLWLAICAVAGVMVSVAMWFLGPGEGYESTATLQIVEPQVPKGLLEFGLDTVQMNDRIRVMKARIFSRSRLERIVHDQGLYEDLQRAMPMQDVIEEMQENLSLERLGEDRILLSVTYPDRHAAQRIASELALQVASEHDVIQSDAAFQARLFLQDRQEAIATRWAELNAEFDRLRPSDPTYARVELDRELARKRYVNVQERLNSAEEYHSLTTRHQAERLQLLNDPSLSPPRLPAFRNGALAGIAVGLGVWLLVWASRRRLLNPGLPRQFAVDDADDSNEEEARGV